MGDTPQVFFIEQADLNLSGGVDVADVVALSNMVMGD